MRQREGSLKCNSYAQMLSNAPRQIIEIVMNPDESLELTAYDYYLIVSLAKIDER